MSGYFKIFVVVLILVITIFGGYKYLGSLYDNYTRDILQGRITYLSKTKAPLIDIRINLIEIRKLDPNDLEFLSAKETLIGAIENANKRLAEVYRNADGDSVHSNILYKWVLKKHKVDQSLISNIADYIQTIDDFVHDFRGMGEKTGKIYNIYLPKDYENYNIDLSAYYKGELQDMGIFTDIKTQMGGVDSDKFNTLELTHRLDELQVIFEECVAGMGKEAIAFSDLAECEDALSIHELKELAYFSELSYFNSEKFLNFITNLTNDIYRYDFVISSIDSE